MSRELGAVGDVSVTAFSGGAVRGPCIQLTPQFNDFAQLTRADVQKLVLLLLQWLFSTRAAR